MNHLLAILSKVTAARRINKSTLLLCQGDIPQHVHIVRSGAVKVYRIGSNGNEQISGFKTAGDIFPEGWTFNRTSNTMYCYETVEGSSIIRLERDKFLDILNANPEIKESVFSYMVKNYAGAMIQLTALEQPTATEKVLMTLYYIMIRHGVEKKPGQYWIMMKMSQATIAGLTGLTRETVTTEMVKLRKKGVVKYDARRFVIFRDVLRDFIDDDIFDEVDFEKKII